jgi:hypothetical protein
MKLNKRERELLTTFASLAQKLLASNGSAPNGSRPRLRRSRAEAARLRKQVLAARRRNLPVKDIADQLGITPSYVYQLQR